MMGEHRTRPARALARDHMGVHDESDLVALASDERFRELASIRIRLTTTGRDRSERSGGDHVLHAGHHVDAALEERAEAVLDEVGRGG